MRSIRRDAMDKLKDMKKKSEITEDDLKSALEEGQKIVESLDGVEALWCTTDGQLVTSSGWSSHEKK